MSNNLKWNLHVESICKKVVTRLYFLRQLKRAKLPCKDLLLFYWTCIRPVAEYASPVFHHALPQYLSNDLENLQKRAMRIIQPNSSYSEVLKELHVPTLFSRKQDQASSLLERSWMTQTKNFIIFCHRSTRAQLTLETNGTSIFQDAKLIGTRTLL